MRRRDFITLFGGAAASPIFRPLAAPAQQPGKLHRIGFLGLVSATSHAPRIEALRAGLRDLGYVEGRNIAIEFRWADGNYDRLPALAAELVRLDVDVILTHAAPGALAAKQATTTIPIVITAVADMLALGLVSSLARPGGNVTGLSFFNPELVAKRLELLKELLPPLAKAAVLLNPDNPAGRQLMLQALEPTARALNVGLQPFEARGPGDFERVFAAMANQQIGALVIHEDTMLNANVKAIAHLAAMQRLPACGFPEFAAAGGLMAYGINFPDMDRRAAAFVDKILKGAKPGDLPIERSTKFRTIVNLRAAKAIGIEVPTSLLLRADEVLE
jgi:putative ABC transport system substrate-binding protein